MPGTELGTDRPLDRKPDGRLERWRRSWSTAKVKTTVLSVSLLAACGAVALMGIGGIALMHERNSLIGFHSGPASSALALMQLELTQAQLSIERSLVETDPIRISEIRSSLIGSLDKAGEHLIEYKQLMSNYPGEEQKQLEVYEEKREQWLKALSDTDSRIPVMNRSAPAKVPPELLQAYTEMRGALDKVVKDIHNPNLASAVLEVDDTSHKIMWTLGISMAGIFLAGLVLTTHTAAALSRQQRKSQAMAEEREAQNRRQEFEARLTRGLDMVRDEPSVLRMVEEALQEAVPSAGMELLLADSSRAHLHQAAVTRGEAVRSCGVSKPVDCPAIRRGRLNFASSKPFDSCPHLRAMAGAPCSAVCVPVSIMGQTVGVLHCSGEEKVLPTKEQVETVELVASKLGERIGVLRAFQKSEAQAQSDPLTGLRNRRSLEERVHELAMADSNAVVAYCDIDHFKQLNDTHGHDTGDKALRTFSQTLRTSVRPVDIVARWGGEEFVIVMPETDLDEAVGVINGLRQALIDTLRDASSPAFTASFGVALWRGAELFSDALDRADEALLTAKRTGRNRVVVAPGDGAGGEKASAKIPNTDSPGEMRASAAQVKLAS